MIVCEVNTIIESKSAQVKIIIFEPVAGVERTEPRVIAVGESKQQIVVLPKMDAAVAWLQEEQLGPAKDTWINIWETNNEIHQLEQQQQQQTMAVTNPNSNSSSLEANKTTTNNNNSNKTNSDAGTIMQSQPPVPSSSPPIDTAVATKNPSSAVPEDTTPVVSANGPGHVPQQPPHHHPQGQNGNPMLDRAYNPTRRKLPEKYENKASTYNMNKYQQKLIRKYNGCPWRQKNKKYSPGILG